MSQPVGKLDRVRGPSESVAFPRSCIHTAKCSLRCVREIVGANNEFINYVEFVTRVDVACLVLVLVSLKYVCDLHQTAGSGQNDGRSRSPALF